MPLISVVMSVYNAEKYLRASIDSILNQSFKDFEFILINDGSSDNSLKIIDSYNDKRIVAVNQGNQGLSKSLNTGISLAKGKYIARMDADDISLPTRFEEQLEYLENTPVCIMVGSNANIIDHNGDYLYMCANPQTWEEINEKLPESSFFHSSVMFRKQAWVTCKGYPENVVHHFEDKVLWNKFAAIGELHNLNKPLIYYRLVPSSISNADYKAIKKLRALSNKLIYTGHLSPNDIEALKTLTTLSKRKRLSNYYLRVGTIYLSQNFRRTLAWKNLFQSMMYHPINPSLLFNIMLSFLPKSFILSWKNRRGKS